MDPFDQGGEIEGGEAALRKLRKAGEGVVSGLSCAPRVSITMNSLAVADDDPLSNSQRRERKHECCGLPQCMCDGVA